jgi:hypothetical protein
MWLGQRLASFFRCDCAMKERKLLIKYQDRAEDRKDSNGVSGFVGRYLLIIFVEK